MKEKKISSRCIALWSELVSFFLGGIQQVQIDTPGLKAPARLYPPVGGIRGWAR